MAETAGSLTTEVSRRVRDPNNTAHAVADIYVLLTHAQRIVNSHTRALLVSEDYILVGNDVTGTTRACAAIDRIETIRFNDVDLARVPWQSLKHNTPRWLTTYASWTSLPFWSPIGRMLFAVTPGPTTNASITIVGTKVTTALTSASSATEIRDQHMPAILNIVEQLLLLRQRLFVSAQQSGARRPYIARIGTIQ